MTKIIKLLGCSLLIAATSFFQSCKDDNGYSIGDIGVDWVTVHVEGDGYYSFIGDSWGTMWPAATSIWNYKPVEGERAILYFNPLYDNYQGFDHAIKSESIYPILTKQVEQLTSENESEFADDPAYITDAWVSGGYMNIVFVQRLPQEHAHKVSLVENLTSEPEDDGYVHLEYRYNTYGDSLSAMPLVSGAVSYNLNTLDLENANGIKLRINSAVNGERVIVFEKNSKSQPNGVDNIDISSMKVQ